MRLHVLCWSTLAVWLGVSCQKVDTPAPCKDTRSDMLNCGVCGHSCWGAACVEGKCQAAGLSSGDALFTAPTDGTYTAFACKDGQTDFAVCVTRIDSYWDARFGPTKFASLDPDTKSLAVVDGVVYWPSHDGLHSCSAKGCESPTTPFLAAPEGALSGALLASGKGQLVWTPARDTPGAGELRRCTIASCAATQETVYRSPTPAGTTHFIKPLRTDGTWAVFMEGFAERQWGALLACRLDDCQGTVKTILERTDNALEGFAGPVYAIHDGRVVMASEGKVMTCVLPDCVPVELFSVPKVRVVQVDFDAEAAYLMALDPGELLRCPLTGCSAPEPLLADVIAGKTTYSLTVTPRFFLFGLDGNFVKVAR